MRLLASTMLVALALPSVSLAAREAVIELHMGYGTPSSVLVSGRVIDDRKVRLPAVHRTATDNLIDSLKVLDSRKIEGAVVQLEVGGQRVRARTDEDGSFEARLSGIAPPLPLGDQPVVASLVAGRGWVAPEVRGHVRVLPDDDAHVVVLSDYDDTVVQSHAKNKLALGMGAVFRNALQLEPVPGVGIAYRRALDAGARGFFFLSGSPVSFYPRVSFFLAKNDIPRGPLLLKDFGKDDIFEQLSYKRRRLERLLALLPKTRFVLVGDSGEHDPEIYAALRQDHPDRVVGIVIRRVPRDDSPAARFTGMRVVDDYAGSPDVVAAFVRDALARGRALEGEVGAEVEGAEHVDVGGLGVDAVDAHPRPAEERLPHAEAEAHAQPHDVTER